MRKGLLYGMFVLCLGAAAIAAYLFVRYGNSLRRHVIMALSVPSAQEYRAPISLSPYSENTLLPSQPSPHATPIPPEINLAIPFIPQAPHQNWDLPYQEFCEEASMLMASSFINRKTIADADAADRELLAIKVFEEQRLGHYEDTDVAEVVTVLTEYFHLPRVAIVDDPTIDTLKNTLAQGKAIIIPAAGRRLGNPYYHQPGPLYHMLIIKGYTTDGKFITNDPGTRRGANYLYDANILWNAIHDWNGGDVDHGRKVVIVAG